MTTKLRYKVTTGGYTPEGKWSEQVSLMDFKGAAAYAVKVVQKESEPTQITVWDMNFEAVERLSAHNVARGANADFYISEYAYIVTAINNAIKEKYDK